VSRFLGISLALLLVFAVPVFAQSGAVRSVVLEYADDISTVRVIDRNGRDVGDIYYGYEFSEGDSIRTGPHGGAEVRLHPNGSIVRIGPDTTFRFDELQRRSTSDPNQFSVYAGKVRIVAARIRGTNYLVRTPTSALGVRGTDFVVEVRLGLRETILVRDGSVEVFNKSSRRSIIVDEGEWTDVLDDQSDVLDWDDWTDEFGEIDDYYEDLDFEDLDVADVFEDEFYESDYEYFDGWDDEEFEDDFLDDYEWDDEYLEEEFFDEADWLSDEDGEFGDDESRDFETDYSDDTYDSDEYDDYDDDGYYDDDYEGDDY